MARVKLLQLNLSFVEPEYRETWGEWMRYKEQIKAPYRTQMGVEKAYKHLKNISNNDPDMARAYVDYSIEREWKGIFAHENATRNYNKRQPTIFDLADAVLQGV